MLCERDQSSRDLYTKKNLQKHGLHIEMQKTSELMQALFVFEFLSLLKSL